MSLRMGVMHFEYLTIPRGFTYEFVKEMAQDVNADEWARGDGQAYLYFERAPLRTLLKDFAVEHNLPFEEETAIWAWLASLPWTHMDTLELHFSW